jgi:hypothetical protein
MSGLQQGKWRRPHEQLSLWDDGSSEPFVASSISESPTGLTEATEEGVPQGGPLSPVLSNVVLDELAARGKSANRRESDWTNLAGDV